MCRRTEPKTILDLPLQPLLRPAVPQAIAFSSDISSALGLLCRSIPFFKFAVRGALRSHTPLLLLLQILEHSGLDFYGIDSCHTRHIIVKGMQLHILVGRQGNGHSVILAWSLDAGETNSSYTFFSRQCKLLGLENFMVFSVNPFDRTPVAWADGMKGVYRFWEFFHIHQARCGYHGQRRVPT